MKKTLYVQPGVHNNQYTEFMIPKNTLQNFRLIDLGVQDYVANGGGGGRNYNYLSGAVSIIDTISLYNDTELINQCRNCDKVMGFTQLSEGIMTNYSKTSQLNQSQLNIDVDNIIQVDSRNVNPILGAKNPTYLDLWRLLPFLMGLDLDKFNELQTSLKNKNVKKVRSILRTSNVINANKLNLRMVIEYSTKSPSQLFGNANDGDTYNVSKPVLVVDQVMAESSNSFQVVYDNWDNEIINITPVASGQDKKEDRILYGAEGKYISDVWVLNCATVSNLDVSGYLDNGSYALFNEMVNLVVNESMVIPNNQCDTPARKALYLHYTNPLMMCPLLSNLTGHGGTANNQLYGPSTSITSKGLGKYSYVSFNIDKVVKNMRLYLDFKAIGAGVTLGNVNVNLFYRTKKTLSYNNGQTLISN